MLPFENLFIQGPLVFSSDTGPAAAAGAAAASATAVILAITCLVKSGEVNGDTFNGKFGKNILPQVNRASEKLSYLTIRKERNETKRKSGGTCEGSRPPPSTVRAGRRSLPPGSISFRFISTSISTSIST